MVDFADEGSQNEERSREQALADHAERQRRIAASHAPRNPAAEALCLDCDEAIEPVRLRLLPCVSRCAACAHVAEQRMRTMYGG